MVFLWGRHGRNFGVVMRLGDKVGFQSHFVKG